MLLILRGILHSNLRKGAVSLLGAASFRVGWERRAGAGRFKGAEKLKDVSGEQFCWVGGSNVSVEP